MYTNVKWTLNSAKITHNSNKNHKLYKTVQETHKKTKAAFPHSPKLQRAHSCGHGQSEGSFILLALTM